MVRLNPLTHQKIDLIDLPFECYIKVEFLTTI